MSRKTCELIRDWKFYFGDAEDSYKQAFDDVKFKAVTIPHDWAISRPINPNMQQGGSQGFLDRWGIGWYRRELTVEDYNAESVYQLEFDGVYENSTVWLNEKQVGGKLFGYSGFCIDVTDVIKQGVNLLAVKVDNTVAPADRWYSGAGIYRGVRLIETAKSRFAQNGVMITTKLENGTAIVEIEAETISRNPSEIVLGGSVSIDGSEVSSVKGDAGSNKLIFKLENPKLWDAEDPNLYSLTLRLYENGAEKDDISLKFGVRTVDFVPRKGLFVNGKSTKLKGVCLHHDAGGLGAAVTEWTWRKRLLMLKEIGCNAIRTSHNIASTELMDLCDELGFYVIDECFDKWVSGYYKRYFDTEWRDDLLFMLRRDRYRPSVIMWSVGNEVEKQGEESMIAILRDLVAFVKEHEPTRPAIVALAPAYFFNDPRHARGGDTCIEMTNMLAKETEILACNYHEQWYGEYHDEHPDKLIVGTETFLYFRGSREDCHGFCSPNPWIAVEENDYVIGGFLWAGIDYLGESMGMPAKGWPSGLFTTSNARKPISYLFESYWLDKPMVNFTVFDLTQRDDFGREPWMCPTMASHWNFEQFRRNLIPFGIFSNCEEVELYLNDKFLVRKKPADFESRIVTGYIPGTPGEVKVVGLNGGNIVCEHITRTSGAPARLELSLDRKSILSDGRDVCHAEVKVVDKDGNICYKASNSVRFTVKGAAVIAAVDNGDLLCQSPFVSDASSMFRGYCSAVIRSNGETGAISVSVSGDGLLSDSQTLIAE